MRCAILNGPPFVRSCSKIVNFHGFCSKIDMSFLKPLHCTPVRLWTPNIIYAWMRYMTRKTKQLHCLPNEQARYAMFHFEWPPICEKLLQNRQFSVFWLKNRHVIFEAIALQTSYAYFFLIFALFSSFSRQSFLDFFRILYFLYPASSGFFIISLVQLLTSQAIWPMKICIRANTFPKKIIKSDPYVPSNPDFGPLSFRPFFVLMLPIVFFTL